MAKRKLDWRLTLIMSILFGWLGVDRFMMGKVGTGILKLMLTIISLGRIGWIWWVIDITLIATKYPYNDVIWVEKK